MRYELKNGRWTEVMVLRIGGKLKPFPTDNAKLVIREGTRLSKVHLEQSIGEHNYKKLKREVYE